MEQKTTKGTQAKPWNVARRVLEPMNNAQLLVYTRTNAYDWNTGEYRPFSCRSYTSKRAIEYTTVIGVLMPDKSDPLSEPILRTFPADKYYDLIECEPIKDDIRNIVREIEYVTLHGSLDQLRSLRNGLQQYIKEITQ